MRASLRGKLGLSSPRGRHILLSIRRRMSIGKRGKDNLSFRRRAVFIFVIIACVVLLLFLAAVIYERVAVSGNIVLGNVISDDGSFSVDGSKNLITGYAVALKDCGNGIADRIEACDGSDLKGYNCTSVAAGYKSGTLACRADCTGFDVSRCAKGSTITAVSCSLSDVQNSVNSASDGDTVLIPAGQCDWSSGTLILGTKSILLTGSGNLRA